MMTARADVFVGTALTDAIPDSRAPPIRERPPPPPPPHPKAGSNQNRVPDLPPKLLTIPPPPGIPIRGLLDPEFLEQPPKLLAIPPRVKRLHRGAEDGPAGFLQSFGKVEGGLSA